VAKRKLQSVDIAPDLTAAFSAVTLESVEAMLLAASERATPHIAKALKRAARALYQQPGGRPPGSTQFAQRDQRDLREADQLLADGIVKSRHAAHIRVSEKYPGTERDVRSNAERLRRANFKRNVPPKSF